MQKMFKGILAAVCAAMLVIGMAGCGNDPGGGGGGGGDGKGSGNYTGKDVLGNSYTLTVGSDSTRAAKKGDRYNVDLKTRDGKTRHVTGTVEDISADGTLTLKPDDSEDTFTAVVSGSELNSVAGDEISFTGDGGASDIEIMPRSFSNVYLRATRWENTSAGFHGENWGTGNSILVTDFASNVSYIEVNNDYTDNPGRYTITISGTSSVAIPYPEIEIQGITEEGEWIYIGGRDQLQTTKMSAITANTSFEQTVALNIWGDEGITGYNLLDYKEVVMQLTNVINRYKDGDETQTINNGTIPDDVADGDIMVTITNFNVSLKDTKKEKLAGNMGDYYFGYAEDGLSKDYRQAVWSLSAEQVADAKQTGAKFEFFVTDLAGYTDPFGTEGPSLVFIWQDPVRGLWWQDMSHVSGGTEESNYTVYALGDGVTWEDWRTKISIDLGTVINDTQFASATALNFVVALWWNGTDWDTEGYKGSIGEVGIAGANLVKGHPATTGNMGNYRYGDASVKERAGEVQDTYDDYFLIDYSMAVWNLPETALTNAKEASAKLVIEFNKDMESVGPALGLAWSDVENQHYWVQSAAKIYSWDEGQQKMVWGDEATWHSATKTLTIDLSAAFSVAPASPLVKLVESDSNNIEFTLASFYDKDHAVPEWGITNINELDIKHASIVMDDGSGEQSDGSYLFDPTKFAEWYGATGAGTDTIAFTEGGVRSEWPADFDITDYNSLEIKVKLTAYTAGTKGGGLDVIVKTFNDTTWDDNSGGENVKYSKLEGYDPGATPSVGTTYTLTINDKWNGDQENGPTFADLWHATTATKGWGIAINDGDTDAEFTLQFVSITFNP